jgi:hypothetical protein
MVWQLAGVKSRLLGSSRFRGEMGDDLGLHRAKLDEPFDRARIDRAAAGVHCDLEAIFECREGSRPEDGWHSELSGDGCEMTCNASFFRDDRRAAIEKSGPSRQRLSDGQHRPPRKAQRVRVPADPIDGSGGCPGAR